MLAWKGTLVTDPDTPLTPQPPNDGISAAPDETPATPTRPGAEPPEAPAGSPTETVPPAAPTAPGAPAGGAPAGGRGGCMTAMIGLFVFIAALLGLVTQL
jgi:hypothetical protein